MKNKPLTLGSLFDGSGGFPLGGLLAGITPVWASEIEPFPIRVTTKRLPFMKHYGNISAMDGGRIEPMDIITFGSPCQDMSVAGRRDGLDGARSSLFYAPAGEIYEKNDLIFLLGDNYSKSTRDNAVTALLETFRHSPIGTVLKQGIPIPNGNSYKFSKQGWNTPDVVAILYALYMWAEATGRYTFTLGQMAAARGNAEAKGVDPVSIFGINPDRFKDILQDMLLLMTLPSR